MFHLKVQMEGRGWKAFLWLCLNEQSRVQRRGN